MWGPDACFDADGARKNAVLFGDTKVLQSSPGEHPTSVSSHLQLYIYCINVCYIYIFNYILFFHWVCSYTTARWASQRSCTTGGSAAWWEGQLAVAPKRLRSTASEPTVALHRSAHVVHAGHVTVCTSARVVAVALTGHQGKRPIIYSVRVCILIIN